MTCGVQVPCTRTTVFKGGRIPPVTPIDQVRETRHCGRATDRGKEATSQSCEVTNRNPIPDRCGQASEPTITASSHSSDDGKGRTMKSRGERPTASHFPDSCEFVPFVVPILFFFLFLPSLHCLPWFTSSSLRPSCLSVSIRPSRRGNNLQQNAPNTRKRGLIAAPKVWHKSTTIRRPVSLHRLRPGAAEKPGIEARQAGLLFHN
jgi:hypothetical protein